MRARKLIFASILATGVVTALLVVALVFMDLGVFRGQLEARVSQAFARRVELAGPIRLKPSLPLGILVEDIRIGNPVWASRRDFARVQRLELQVGLLALLRGELDILDAIFKGADVLLEQGPGDSNNFTFGRRDGPPELSDTATFKVQDSEFGYRDLDGAVQRCAVQELQARSVSKQRVSVAADLTCRDVPFEFSVTAGTPEEFASATVPWPLDIKVSTNDTEFTATGLLPKPRLWKGAELTFSLKGETADSIERLLDIPWVNGEPFDLSGNWRNDEQGFSFSRLNASFGATEVAGNLIWTRIGERPRLEGTLQSRSLRLQDLAFGDESKFSGDEGVGLLDRLLPYEWLRAFDGKLELDFEEIVDTSPKVRDISFNAALEDGVLAFSRLRATVGGVPLEGDFGVTPAAEGGEITLAAQANNLNLRETLAELGTDWTIDADVGDVALVMHARGQTLRDLIDSSLVDLEVGEATIRSLEPQTADRWRLDLDLKQIAIRAHAAQPMTASAQGTFRGVPVALTAQTLSPVALINETESWAFDLQANADGAALELDGVVKRKPDGGTTLALRTALEGERAGSLEPFLGAVLPDVGPYRFAGVLHAAGQSLMVSGLEAQIGSSDIAGELNWSTRQGRPRLDGKLASNTIRIQDFAPTDTRGESGANTKAPLDQALALDWLTDLDAELELSLQRVLGLAAPMRDLAGTAKLTGGRLELSLARATIAGTPLYAESYLAVAGGTVEIGVSAQARRLDVRGVLDELQAGSQLRGSLADVKLDLTSRGTTLRQLIRQADLDLRAGEGHITTVAGIAGQADGIDISSLALQGKPDQPIQVRANGTYKGKPLLAVAQVITLDGLATDVRPWPVKLSLEALEASLQVTGTIANPYRASGFDFAVEMTGSDLGTLYPLADFVIPLDGSFRVKGHVRDKGGRFELSNLAMVVGDSDISGSLSVAMTQSRPRISADLQSRVVQYEDLKFVGGAGARAETAMVIPDYRLPVEALRAVDLDVELQVGEIRARGSELGNLRLSAMLENGRSYWSAQATNEVGGRLDADYRVDAGADPPANELRLTTRDLDYGLLLTGAELVELAEGQVDIDISLSGPGASLRRFLRQANGHLSIAGGAGRIASREYGLWSSDLVRTMLTASWRRETTTQINCIFGQIDVDNGVATTDAFLVDTTRLTIAGSGSLDLRTEQLDVLISPRPKQARLVSVANPVRVTGSLAAPNVAVTVLPTRRRATTGVLAGLINPALMIVTFADLGSERGNKCLAAAEKLNSARGQ